MPLEMRDPDDDDSMPMGTRSRERFGEAGRPWWRPESTVGRVFLGLGALLVAGSFVTGVLAVKNFLGRDSRFRIAGTGNIEATGLTEVSRAEMLPVFGEDIGKNIFFVHLDERRKQLEQIPWVERATVMRLLPDQIRVNVVERQPVAFVRQGQQVGLVDKDGVLLTMPAAMMAQHNYSFPVVTGIDPRDPLAARTARMAVYMRLVGELDANNHHLSEQISEIDLTDPQDARVLLPEQGTDILGHFGEDRFMERYQRYKAHIAEWREQYPKLAAVDLRYDNQVVLEMKPGTNAVSAAIDGPNGPSTAKPSAGTAGAENLESSRSKPSASKLADAPATVLAKPAAKPEKEIVDQSEAKPAPVKQAAGISPKAPAKKAVSAETLAARQRATRAAKAKAARDKAERDKKRAAQQHTAQNNQRPYTSFRPAAAVAQGQ
jgi:cell division protein FtsQ